MKNWIKKIIHTIESSYLCLVYPFLYPRNRFTGKHYNNWKIHEYLYGKYETRQVFNEEFKRFENVSRRIPGLRDRAYEHIFLELDFPDPDGSHFRTYDLRRSIWLAMWFHIVEFFNDYITPIFHFIPTFTEWDAMPIGWKKAFGKQYLKDLRKQLVKDKMLYSWRITQIKEKYGTLRLYCNNGSEELYKLIDKYEDMSYYICIDCGKQATKLSSGYICPYCDDCFEKQNSYLYAELKDSKWEYVEDEEV